ncbi:YbjN domain-containing protein [Sphingomonas sp. Leaf4]|uniref:YbjN domain-containing protein n=1 Tax=Sphingomonas sp. Leaf4 TaxID=2876553 RepID=UPI001E3310F2|nr:YbjN domain-containing protein [Sphingomonas sp. Leaf4]
MIGTMMALVLGVQAAGAADLRQPGNVVSALQAAGYKAQLKLNKDGEPFIESATNGDPFTIDFYECDGLKDCKSMQFSSWYKKEPIFTPAVANEWNAKRRFLKVAVDSDGDMRQFLDATVVGGMSQAQFAEVVQWYSDMDGMFATFLKEKREAAKGKVAGK